MEPNPLKDIVENAKQRSLEEKIKSIQDDLASVRNDMQVLMGQFEKLNTTCTQLNRELVEITIYLGKHQNIDDPKLPPTYVK